MFVASINFCNTSNTSSLQYFAIVIDCQLSIPPINVYVYIAKIGIPRIQGCFCLSRWLDACGDRGWKPAVADSKMDFNFIWKIFASDLEHAVSITDGFHTHRHMQMQHAFTHPPIQAHTHLIYRSVTHILTFTLISMENGAYSSN